MNNQEISEILNIIKQLPGEFQNFRDRNDERLDAIENAVAMQQMPDLTGTPDAVKGPAPYGLHGPKDNKSYASLFGKQDSRPWEDPETSFFQAVFSGRHHPGLVQASAMTENIPGDGGFLVPTEQTKQIHAVSLENELVMPRCFVQPMKSNELKIPAMEIGDHGSNLYGGSRRLIQQKQGKSLKRTRKRDKLI